MADEKISQLADGTSPQDTDQFPLARSGSTLSLTWAELKAGISAGVSSVFGRTGAVTAQTGDYTAAQVGALPSTETLDQIATANATAANVNLNSHKITNLTNGSGAQDAAAFGQIPTALPPNGTAGGDLAGSYPNPTVKAITETSGPTDLVAGTIADGQFLKRSAGTLVSGVPAAAGTAGGDLAGSYPNPTVKALTETSGPTDLVIGTITDGQFLKRVGSTLVSATAGGSGTPLDGWIDDTADTWTYASGSGGGTATFTIAGVDRTATLTPGTRIKLTQTTVKYFVVISSTFSTNTTVTITAGTSYTLANAAISANFHSYVANPQGYPGWFSFAAATTGFASFTAQTTRFSVIGRTCTLQLAISGTSNSTSFAITAPITSSANIDAGVGVQSTARVQDNSSAGAVGLLAMSQSSATVTLFKDVTTAAWTASNVKAVFSASFEYEI